MNQRELFCRVKVEDTKLAARIRDLIAGMHYIPIYKEYDLDGPSILGKRCLRSLRFMYFSNYAPLKCLT